MRTHQSVTHFLGTQVPEDDAGVVGPTESDPVVGQDLADAAPASFHVY